MARVQAAPTTSLHAKRVPSNCGRNAFLFCIHAAFIMGGLSSRASPGRAPHAQASTPWYTRFCPTRSQRASAGHDCSFPVRCRGALAECRSRCVGRRRNASPGKHPRTCEHRGRPNPAAGGNRHPCYCARCHRTHQSVCGARAQHTCGQRRQPRRRRPDRASRDPTRRSPPGPRTATTILQDRGHYPRLQRIGARTVSRCAT